MNAKRAQSQKNLLTVPINHSGSMRTNSMWGSFKEQFLYESNSQGTYVKTNHGWIFINVLEYAPDLGIEYYRG